MSQNTTVVGDGTGVQVLAGINAALDTLNTLHAGAAAPADAECHVNMLWADTSANPALLKVCTVVGAPSTFVTLGQLTANFGLVPLVGDSNINGHLTLATGKNFTLTNGKLTLTAGELDFASAAPASAATLPVIGGNLLLPTGTTTITALGTAQAGAMRQIRFTTALQLTNSAALLLFGKNIVTESGDSALFFSLGGGNWYLHSYQRGDGSVDMDGAQLNEAQGANIAAAATTNLANMTGNYAIVTNTSGATAITALGTTQAGARRQVTFSITGGSISITHHATSLILPGGANISITDGDSALFMSLGGGYWRMLHYQKNSLAAQVWSVTTKNSSYTVTTADSGKFFVSGASAPNTFSLPSAASAGAGFICGFRNANTNSATMSIAANGSEKVEGVSTLVCGVGTSIALICDGTTWYRMDTGVSPIGPQAFVVGSQVFLTSGTLTVPAGTWYIRLTMWGAGSSGAGGGGAYSGASASCSAGAGGSGAAGAFATGIFAVIPGQTYTVTVGLAGTPGVGGSAAGGNGTNGTAGGTTSFGSLLTCTGGTAPTGGTGCTTYNTNGAAGTSGTGGTASGSGTLINGGNGGVSTAGSYTTYGSGASGGSGVAGGVSGGAQSGADATGVTFGAGRTGSGGAAKGASTSGTTRESGGSNDGRSGNAPGSNTAGTNGLNGGSPGAGGTGGSGASGYSTPGNAGGNGGLAGDGKVIVEW